MIRRHLSRLLPFVLLASVSPLQSATHELTPSGSYQVLQSANPGDVVLIAPGTYRFRVHLTKAGTASNPVIIRAKDPANRPVWDLGGKNVDQWPGTYSSGDASRGAWQINGSGYVISDIAFKNATNGTNSAGLRIISGRDITVRNCLFQTNDNGMSGKGENVLVEFCEFDRNGKPGSSKMTHNIYNFGGSWTLRHCYLHDPTHGQNFHFRAREAVIEYCWIARAKSYEGDVMTGPDRSHKLVMRGNVIIQSPTPGNKSKLFTLYNDTGDSGVKMHLDFYYNTVIGNGGDSTHVIALQSGSMEQVSARMHNNVVYKVRRAMSNQGGSNWSFTGSSNWFSDGTDSTGLPRSYFGADPGFRSAGSKDYTLVGGAAAAGKADATGTPDREYFLNEQIRLRYRFRSTSRDLGAFESSTIGPDLGVYDDAPADHVPPEQPRNLRLVGE